MGLALKSARVVLALATGVAFLWQITFYTVDWLARFDFVLQQISAHGWIADVIEAVLKRPPPFELIGSLILLVTFVLTFFAGRWLPEWHAGTATAAPDEMREEPTAPSVKPRLNYVFDDTKQDCRDETTLDGVLPAVFFRIHVMSGEQPHHDCRGKIVYVERNDGNAVAVYTNQCQLTWATVTDPLPTAINIAAGDAYNLDVFFITATGAIGFATPRFVQPNNLAPDYFGPFAVYTFVVVLSSDEAGAQIVRLQLDWRGNWQTARVRLE